jgi:hypothetical protein
MPYLYTWLNKTKTLFIVYLNKPKKYSPKN